MKYNLEQFIDEAIQLELHAAEIYAIFSEVFPEDADFWAGLSWEERNHATLLKTGKDLLLPTGQFPEELLPRFIQSLIDTNRWLKSLQEEYAEEPPEDRRGAFANALKIENSAGEQHFQRVMEKPPDSRIMAMFQELCENDINHLVRIREYMRNAGLSNELPSQEAKRILLVVDDDGVAKLLQTILATEGEVDIVEDTREGLRKIRENHYDLIISAIEMPMRDSVEFFREAKNITPDQAERFLFFTGPPTPELLAFFHHENLRHLAKPASIREIREAALRILLS